MLTYIPKYFTNKAIGVYFIVLFASSLLSSGNFLPFLWILFGGIEVMLFFYFSNTLSVQWANLSEQKFRKKLFTNALIIRVVFVVFSYFFFDYMTGKPFEFESADAKGYHGEALWIIGLFDDGNFARYLKYIGSNYSDMGYPMYLAFIYYFTNNSILIVRIIKAILSAYSCLMIYQIGKRNFGENVGRMSGIMSMLLPNLIFYCGLHVKETEMVFLVITFFNAADKILLSKKIRFVDIFLICLTTAAVYFLRTVLVACFLLAFGLGVLTISSKIIGQGKKILLSVGSLVAGLIIFSTQLTKNFEKILSEQSYSQARQLQSFTYRKDGEGGGNKLAKYGSRTVFLPMILAAPFPTLVDTKQENIMMLNGGYFTRNIYAFFVIVAFVFMVKRKTWRAHLLIISFVLGYLFILASSAFALSERFHLPALPFLIILAAYGISEMNNQNKKYYVPYLVFISLVIIGWNWFKLAGRV